jgi:O-antigen ligase
LIPPGARDSVSRAAGVAAPALRLESKIRAMLQKIAGLFRALARMPDAKPKTRRDWVMLGLAVALHHVRTWGLHLWRGVTHRPKRLPILQPYVNTRSPGRIAAKILLPIGLTLVCIVYGFMFGLTAPFLIVPFAAPIAVLMLMAIWALPDTHNAPVKSMEAFYAAVLVSLLVWPNYLALSLPGLPWITAMRLTSFPLAFLFLVCLSTSPSFRSEVMSGVRSAPGLLTCYLGFVVIQFATIGFSKSASGSIGVVTNAQLNWTMPFLVGLWLARQPGKAQTYITMLVVLTLPMVITGMLESRLQHLLWLGHVPSFLKIDDALAAQYMGVVMRGGVYRVKSVYASPLSFSEAMALITPFCLHFAAQKYKPPLRLLGFVLIPVYFYCIRSTDARLGIMGMLVSFLAYFLLWALLELGRKAQSLWAATIVYAYPAAFGVVMTAVLFVHKVKVMVLGGGETASSNDARHDQIVLGIPKILSHPLGYGAGNAAVTLNYAPFGMITIDNYYLSITLDYGVLGFLMFYGIFVTAVVAAVRTVLKSPAAIDTQEKTLLLPLAVSVTVFVAIRGVLSLEDNHILAFSILGFLVGVLYQVKQTAKAAQEAEDALAQVVRQNVPKGRLTPVASGLPARRPVVGRKNETVR